MTIKTFDYPPHLSLSSLQLQIRNTEGLRRELKKIEALDTGQRKFTLGSFERGPEGLPELRLVLDPNETEAPKAGEKLVCRGLAWLDSQDPAKKVAAFRKA